MFWLDPKFSLPSCFFFFVSRNDGLVPSSLYASVHLISLAFVDILLGVFVDTMTCVSSSHKKHVLQDSELNSSEKISSGFLTEDRVELPSQEDI